MRWVRLCFNTIFLSVGGMGWLMLLLKFWFLLSFFLSFFYIFLFCLSSHFLLILLPLSLSLSVSFHLQISYFSLFPWCIFVGETPRPSFKLGHQTKLFQLDFTAHTSLNEAVKNSIQAINNCCHGICSNFSSRVFVSLSGDNPLMCGPL